MTDQMDPMEEEHHRAQQAGIREQIKQIKKTHRLYRRIPLRVCLAVFCLIPIVPISLAIAFSGLYFLLFFTVITSVIIMMYAHIYFIKNLPRNLYLRCYNCDVAINLYQKYFCGYCDAVRDVSVDGGSFELDPCPTCRKRAHSLLCPACQHEIIWDIDAHEASPPKGAGTLGTITGLSEVETEFFP